MMLRRGSGNFAAVAFDLEVRGIRDRSSLKGWNDDGEASVLLTSRPVSIKMQRGRRYSQPHGLCRSRRSGGDDICAHSASVFFGLARILLLLPNYALWFGCVLLRNSLGAQRPRCYCVVRCGRKITHGFVALSTLSTLHSILLDYGLLCGALPPLVGHNPGGAALFWAGSELQGGNPPFCSSPLRRKKKKTQENFRAGQPTLPTRHSQQAARKQMTDRHVLAHFGHVLDTRR